MASDFQSSREEFAALLMGGEEGFEKFQKRFLSTSGSEPEKKVAVDQALKDILHGMVIDDVSNKNVLTLLRIIMAECLKSLRSDIAFSRVQKLGS